MLIGVNTLPPSNEELRATVASAGPIIAAIRAFEAEHRKPPKSLEELVPKYLPVVPLPKGPAKESWVFLSSESAHAPDLPETRAWALNIEVRGTEGFLQFGDIFAFHSDGVYEERRYGGILLRKVDGWGYYRE